MTDAKKDFSPLADVTTRICHSVLPFGSSSRVFRSETNFLLEKNQVESAAPTSPRKRMLLDGRYGRVRHGTTGKIRRRRNPYSHQRNIEFTESSVSKTCYVKVIEPGYVRSPDTRHRVDRVLNDNFCGSSPGRDDRGTFSPRWNDRKGAWTLCRSLVSDWLPGSERRCRGGRLSFSGREHWRLHRFSSAMTGTLNSQRSRQTIGFRARFLALTSSLYTCLLI